MIARVAPVMSALPLRASQLQEWGASRLTAAQVESALLDARLLLQHALNLPREAFLREDVTVSDGAVTLYDALIARRMKHEPVAKILGRRAFWKQEFLTSHATLDPRPDSETLIEAALRLKPCRDTAYSLLDLGTGTGCLLLSLLEEYPSARGVGVDISPEALALAKENALRLGMQARLRFLRSDWCAEVEGAFDLILCNPPYIPLGEAETLAPDVREHDPASALFGGEDGLDAYRSLLPQLARHLAPEGYALLECGAGQAQSVTALAVCHGLKNVKTVPDLAGLARVIVFRK